MRKRRIISLEVTSGSYGDFVDAIISRSKKKISSYVCVANVHMTIEAYNNPGFADKVNGADIVTPDGMPLVWLFWILYGEKQERVAGMDLMPDLLRSAEKEKTGVFFLGTTDEVLEKIRSKAEKLYPELIISGMFSPPFRKFSGKEREELVMKIINSGASLILVSLGCPKQEILMSEISEKLKGVMVGLGGAFPVFAEVRSRAPRWMQRWSLEWFYRLIKEPGRLWKRYLFTNTKFILLAIREVVRIRVFGKR